MMPKMLRYIDLFAGAGGLSEGFIRAGFLPVAHVECDRWACQTLETRLIYHRLEKQGNLKPYLQYLEGITSRDEFVKTCGDRKISQSVINYTIGVDNKAIYNRISKLLGGDGVDLIIGGPPCQAYSLVGRARAENGMKDDPRNFLYKEYVKYLKRYSPKVFVFENVEGMRNANGGEYLNKMRKAFENAGYHFKCTILDAQNFGVLQKRKRVILIGWRKTINLPDPNFSSRSVGEKKQFCINDLLSDLPAIKPGEANNITMYSGNTTPYLHKHNIRNGDAFVTQHIARPHNDRDLSIYKIAIRKWLGRQERLNYAKLPKRLKNHSNETSFLDRYKVVDPNGYSHTMVAHIAKDGHYYIYPSLHQIRSLSVREAARIQSFPDNYYFEGSRTAAFTQIGNAVPPLMAEQIAKKIREQLQ